jgi:hypothetical protein
MRRETRPSLARYAAASVVLWAVCVGAALWYLRRPLPADVRALPLTHADSVGLPLVAFAGLLAGVLLTANLVAAIFVWRRRRAGERDR